MGQWHITAPIIHVEQYNIKDSEMKGFSEDTENMGLYLLRCIFCLSKCMHGTKSFTIFSVSYSLTFHNLYTFAKHGYLPTSENIKCLTEFPN